jgi:hypothetical protein
VAWTVTVFCDQYWLIRVQAKNNEQKLHAEVLHLEEMQFFLAGKGNKP